MATIRIPGGPAGVRLADIVVSGNPHAQWCEAGGSIEIRAPRLEVRVAMIEQALWPDSIPDVRSARRYLRYLVRVKAGTVYTQTDDRLVVSEESEQEAALLVRFPASLKTRVARAAERLGMSQNEFVIRAVEDLIAFIDEFGEQVPY